ncbi:MAG: hypothetical protein JRN67_03435, partial [Nitrososphaerota archaeon]|nr:hypothetical protein [Nitrososphaerota archaeon]
RKTLSYEIGRQTLFLKPIFTADLAEDYPSVKTDEGVSKLIQKSSLYILLIGYQNSMYTEREFDYAISKGLPILAYEYYRKKDKTYKKIQTNDFLDRVMKSGVKVRGHDDAFVKKSDLIDSVLLDIPEALGSLVNHYTRIKETVEAHNKF